MAASDQPVLSVVIACYNDGVFLSEAVQSAESNRAGRHEIIVVDDGSTDRATLELLDSIERSGHRVLHQANQGPAAARNYGIKVARGRYILPLDSDNRIRAAYIDRGIELLDANPPVDVVYGDPQDFGDRTGRRRIAAFDLPRLVLSNYIDTCTVYRKSAWERVGGYDEARQMRGLEDWDFWIRLGASGSLFLHVDEVLYDYRVRGDSLTMAHVKQSDRYEVAREYLRRKKIELTIGEYSDASTSSEATVAQVRHRPFYTLLRLLLWAYFPSVYARLKPRR